LTFSIALCFAMTPIDGFAETGLPRAPIDDDGLFTNLDGAIGHGSVGVRFRFFMRRVAGSFGSRSGAPTRVENDGEFLRENADHSVPTLTWVGHATVLVQMDHVTFLTDPTWSDTASPVSFAGPPRFVPPGIALEDLPAIDFVLISHNHYDHLDLETLEALAARNAETIFFVPLANADLLRSRGVSRVRELNWGESVEFDGVEVHCLPAQHWSRRGIRDERRALWSSWAVTGPSRRFYFGGDTGYFSGFAMIGKALGPFDLAALPIGAYEPKAMMEQSHLNPEQAVVAGRDVGAQRLVGIHFGTFGLSDEPLDEPPRRMRAAGKEQGFADDDVWILNVGETREF
jgi:N-acyl-phosphatidylethanolamine-hydrolysing phospholipase D